LDREWLSEDELPSLPTPHDNPIRGGSTTTHDDIIRGGSSPIIRSPIPPEPPPIRSSLEEEVVPSVVDGPATTSNLAPEGATSPITPVKATSSSEGDDDRPTSKYWDEDLPEKRRFKPNPKFLQHASAKIRLRDLLQGQLMSLDWRSNALQQASTYYSRMMASLQLATDPYTNEIDGDIHPCLLSSKASQADNPTYEEAMNGPHKEGFYQAMVTELKTLTDMECWDVVHYRLGSTGWLDSFKYRQLSI
jgi:hypothetical protein